MNNLFEKNASATTAVLVPEVPKMTAKTLLKKVVSVVLAAAVFFSMPAWFGMPGITVYAAGARSVTPDWKFTAAPGNRFWFAEERSGFSFSSGWCNQYDDPIKYSDMSENRNTKFCTINLTGSKADNKFSTPLKISTPSLAKNKGLYAAKLQYFPFVLSAYVPAYSEIKMTYNFSVSGEYKMLILNQVISFGQEALSAEVFCWDDASTPSDLQIQIGRTTDRSPGNNNGVRAIWNDTDKKTRIDFDYTVTYINDTGSPKYVDKNFAYSVGNQEIPRQPGTSFDIKEVTLTVSAKKAEQRDCVAIYQESQNGSWLPASLETALEKVYGGGTVKLVRNCTLEKQYAINKNVTITSDNPSSPRTMTRAADGKTNFNVNSGGTLTLRDIIYDGGGKSVTADAQGLSMFRVPAGGTLNLQSGCVLRNNYKSSGSGNVAIYGTMTMENGASITGCEIGGGGGAVWVAEGGSFTMNGGTISGCTAAGGAAISADGTFIMNGGTISGNTDSSANKCDILLRANKSGNVTLKGGSVSGNTNSVYNNGMTVTIAGSSELSGKIYSTNAVTASGSTSKNYTVQMSAIPADKIIVKGSTDTAHWSLANEGYGLVASAGNLIAAQPVTVTYNYGGATGGNSAASKKVYADFTYGDLPSPTKTGYTFDGWYTASSGGTKVISTSTVTNSSAHTLYARWSVCSHTWNRGTVTKQPSCSAVGTKEFTCTKCGQTKTEDVAKKPHTTVIDKAVAATCTATGLTEGSHCSVCKAVIKAQQTVAKKSHTPITDKVVEATCTATGLTEGSHCSVCKAVTKAQQTVAKKPHTPVTDPRVEPTCTKAGKTEGSHCSVCNVIITAQTNIPANGHTWSADYTYSDEQHWLTCDVCGSANTKSGHVWDGGTETKSATEYEEGEILYHCTLCEQTKTEPITKLPHTHKWSDEWNKDKNYHWHECTECGAHEADTAHNWQYAETVNAPSCTEGGTSKYVCSECDEEKTEDDIPPDGHLYSDDWEYDENNHWHLCAVCGAKKSGEATHKWDGGNVTVSQSCTDTGTTVYECGICALTKSEDIPIDAEAHDWNRWEIISEPTDEVTGLAERVCKLNEEHIEREELPALTDEVFWEKGEYTAPKCVEDGAQVYICVYGEFTVVIPQTGHKLVTDNGVEPTCEDTGLTEGNHCEVCGEVLEDRKVIPAVGHSLGYWQSDGAKHWKVCGKCGAIDKEDVHIWNNGEIYEQPTENEAGVMLYTCTVCKATKTEPIAALDHTHDWSDEWSKDDTYHFHDCLKNCGEKKNNAAHIWDDGTVTKQPTADAEGEKTFECTVCGKIKTETLPPKDEPSEPDNGNISVDVQPGENAPDTELKTPFDELADAVLTPEEQENIKNSIDIKIILIVSDATESVPTDDKAKIEAAIRGLSGYKLGQYLDLNLLKIIDNSEGVRITQTNKPITVTFEIPAALRGKAEYSVIRVHGGETDVLRDLDSAPNTATIETDKFSTYALVYKEKNTPSNPSGGNTSGGNPGNSPNPPTSTPDESDNSGDTSSDDDNPSRDDSSDTTSSESKPTDEDNSDAASSDDSNVTSSDDGNPISSESDTSSNVSNHSPNESSPSEDNGNPSTGIAVSLIPLVTATAILTVAVKRKKK